MRFVAIAAILIVLVIAPAHAKGMFAPPPPPPMPPAVQMPPPPLMGWGEQMRFQAIVIGTGAPVDIGNNKFSSSQVAIVSGSTTSHEPINIDFKYTPMHTQSGAAVPEPGGLLALGTGTLGLLGHWQRRRVRAGRQS